jgi:hypothetical protein
MVEQITIEIMKFRKLIYILFATLTISFVGCERDYDDNTQITYYPTFIFEGDEVIVHPLGTSYTDAAVSATEDGVTLPVTVTVTGEMTGYSGTTVVTDVADKYTITYSATNSDGYDGVETRIVYVSPVNGDLVTSLEGLYSADVQRGPAFAVSAQYTGMQYIFIVKTGDNTYEISDALGGYYYIGRGYGYDYAAQGSIITVAGASYSITQSAIPGFGNVVDVSEFVVDPVSKAISFTGTGDFANGVFHVQLYQVQ